MGAPRLASLTLEGFKSFASKVELAFPGAIIAIVGPNGSGKSNICDAIAWVLGEQSARLLRSQTMADVIFAGAPSRDAAGAARVGLTLAADDGRWPDHDGRLDITRRVLRDGTSDYRIGGRRVRLKDVVEALMDAGMGTRAYAIIEQGRIGQVLSVRATERRALFEEAAGITRFRVRRHEAELKLAETRGNLDRVADIAAEVKRQLEAARRQARRAERHRELRHELATVRGRLFALRRTRLAEAAAARRRDLDQARAHDSGAAAALAGFEARHESLRRQLETAQTELAAVRTELSAAETEAARLEAEESAARRESEAARERAERARVEADRLSLEIAAQERQEADLAARVEAAAAAAVAASAEADLATAAAASTDSAAKAAAKAVDESRRALLSAVAAATDARNRSHRLEVELEQNDYQRRRLTAERERLQLHFDDVSARGAAAATHEQKTRGEAAAAEAERLAARAAQESLAAHRTGLAEARDRAAHERWQAHHERESFDRLLASARALPDAIARAVPDSQLLGTVADFLDPDADVAGLLDRAYGELLRLPVLAQGTALDALRTRVAASEGRIELVVADSSADGRPSPLLERAGVADGALGWLSRALPRATVAHDADEAESLSTADADLIVLLPDGTVRQGKRLRLPGHAGRAPGILALRHEARRAARREETAAHQEREMTEALAGAQEQLAGSAERLSVADRTVQETAEALAVAVSTHETLQREIVRLEREREAIAAEVARLDGEKVALSERLAVARDEAERVAARAVDAEGQADRLARAAATALEAAGVGLAEAERKRGLAAVALEREQAARHEAGRHRALREETYGRREAVVAEQAAQAAAVETALERARDDQERLSHVLARSATLRHDAERRSAAEQALKTEVADVQAEVERKRAEHLAARDAAHAAELALTEATGAMDRLTESIAMTLGPGATLPDEIPRGDEVPALEQAEAALQGELEALGPVNELAVAERDELEDRNRFLKEQRRDLERSLESLTETVQDLDATCAERFLAAVQEVNGVFPGVFRELFGGGNASVELSDPDNPLESGVEIRVRPPGKHTQSVLLLSGGEKALSAVALLIALFRIRPAPFCVLDEVDAPLDDANVERLCKLLREMCQDTQFLLITHNRRTMAHADVLYGVTMEEPGVSRIVSVRLED